MDPLSITSGVIAVGTLIAQVTKAFQNLREVCRELPGRLHALNNEVVDLGAILQEVEAVASQPGSTNVTATLDRLRPQLQELHDVLLVLENACSRAKIPLVQARHWSKVQRKLLSLQEDIKTQKSHLHIALGASHSRDLVQIRLDLAAINMGANVRDQMQSQLQKALNVNTAVVASSVDIGQRVEARLGALEKFMKATEQRLGQPDLRLLAEGDKMALDQRRRRSRQNFDTRKPINPRLDAVGFQVRRYTTSCASGCSCVCHVQSWAGTPALLNRVLGQLFVDYAGIPLMRPKCNNDRCQKRASAYLELEYWFPLGLFWSQIIRLHFAYQAHLGPQFQLSTLRRIPDDAPAILFASGGNIEGLQDLFRRGLASPKDVSATRGYSLLRWALYEKRFSTCKFLIYEGADPNYGPPTVTEGFVGSPRNRAHVMLLQGEVRPEGEEAVRLMTRESDFYDEQDLTFIHEAILGTAPVSVETAISLHPAELETKDRAGRTPLAWAAAMGDEVAVALLLAHGANPNTFEVHGSTPLYNACHSPREGAARCCRLLLEAGAETDPERPPGSRASPPFMVACGETRDSLAMKTLIEFGTNVDATAPDGRTPLHDTAKRDLAERALILLEAGASINVKSNSGQTPLTIAVTYNSHRVLKLLLERWYEYSECPRLQGPGLLHLAAMYADTETIKLLTDTDHLRLMYDQSYNSTDYERHLLARPDADEQLVEAFKSLLEVVNNNTKTHADPAATLESGHQSRHRQAYSYQTDDYHVPGSWDDSKTESEWSDWGDDAFEDALSEGLGLPTD